MNSNEIKDFIIAYFKTVDAPFRPSYLRRKDMTTAKILREEKKQVVKRHGGNVISVSTETHPVYDESTRKLIWSDFNAYLAQEQGRLAKSKPTRLWRKKIDSQIVRAFHMFGLMDTIVVVYEKDNQITKIECYDLGYDSPIDGVPSMPDRNTSNAFYLGTLKVDDVGVAPFYTDNAPTIPIILNKEKQPVKKKRKGRVMPPKGFYVMRDDAYPAIHAFEVIYTTGERGGGGHKYCRLTWNNQLQAYDPRWPLVWSTLLWSCVPNQKELDEKYYFCERYEDLPADKNIPLLTV